MSGHLEHEVDARGQVYVVMAMDLAPFVKLSSQESFEFVRGRQVFDEYLDELELTGPCFKRDPEYSTLEQKGYDLELFSHALATDSFTHTYKINKDNIEFPEYVSRNTQFRDYFLPIWEKWNLWFRLSRNGVVTLVMQRVIPEYRRLAYISKDLLDVQRFFDLEDAEKKINDLRSGLSKPGEDRQEKIKSIQQFIGWANDNLLVKNEKTHPPILWQMAVAVIRQFILCCGESLHYEGANGFNIQLSCDVNLGNARPLRERYTVFQFEEMTRHDRVQKNREILPPRKILEDQEYAKLISALLEGVILEGRSTEKLKKSEHYYPIHSSITARKIAENNISSWENEFCIIAPSSAVIYSTPYNKQRVIFPSHQVKYSEYWRCIIRSIEFAVETKVLARTTERATSEQLDEALLLVRGNHAHIEAKKMNRLSNRVANSNRLVAHLRTMSIPQVIFRASYASEKYAAFLTASGADRIREQAEANFRDLSEMLERYYEMGLQLESQRSNEVALGISVIFAGLTLVLAVLTFPSFIADWKANASFFNERWYNTLFPYDAEYFVEVVVVSGLVAMAFGLFNLFRSWRRRNKQLWR